MTAQSRRSADQANQNAGALYEIRKDSDGWAILHDGETLSTLDTRMAAFDNVVSAVRSSIIEGHEIRIKLEGEPSHSKR